MYMQSVSSVDKIGNGAIIQIKIKKVFQGLLVVKYTYIYLPNFPPGNVNNRKCVNTSEGEKRLDEIITCSACINRGCRVE